jgi:hypothetical protein
MSFSMTWRTFGADVGAGAAASIEGAPRCGEDEEFTFLHIDAGEARRDLGVAPAAALGEVGDGEVEALDHAIEVALGGVPAHVEQLGEAVVAGEEALRVWVVEILAEERIDDVHPGEEGTRGAPGGGGAICGGDLEEDGSGGRWQRLRRAPCIRRRVRHASYIGFARTAAGSLRSVGIRERMDARAAAAAWGWVVGSGA